MNQLHLFRILIPSVKSTFKTFQGKKNESIIRQIKPNQISSKFHPLDVSKSSQSTISLLEPQSEITFKMSAFNSQTEEQSQDLEYDPGKKESSSCHLRKNLMNDRIKSLQYEANSPCEDSIVYDQLKALDAYTISIFDGHGGSQLAQYSKQKINSFIDYYLKQNMKKVQNIGQLIKESLSWSYKKLQDSFFQVYQQHVKLGNKKIKSVGTCGITAVVHNDKVYIGNAGDSMGMFILSEGNNLMRTQKTNQRLSVNNRVQRQKIKEKWKEVDEDIISQQVNNCFYLKGRLQPTRTIGDYYLKKTEYFNGQGEFRGPYLSCDPDINQFRITPAHKYMVLASDGLWDVLSKNQVMGSLMNGQEIDLNKTCYEQIGEEQSPFLQNTLESVLKKCGEVTGKSLKQIKKIEPGRRRNYHDDITIAVINLENQI